MSGGAGGGAWGGVWGGGRGGGDVGVSGVGGAERGRRREVREVTGSSAAVVFDLLWKLGFADLFAYSCGSVTCLSVERSLI